MTGLYNIVFGHNSHAQPLATILAAREIYDPGRFRDCWAETSGDDLIIAVYTRNGGGNREDQDDAITSMEAHPWYVADADDSFDSTYATFRFRLDIDWVTQWLLDEPDPQTQEQVDAILATIREHAHDGPLDTDARWLAAIEAVRNSST